MANAIVTTKNQGSVKISQKSKKILINDKTPGNVKINEFLPFRVSFKNIGIRSYGPNNAAPIGIAIIGLNNYIL